MGGGAYSWLFRVVGCAGHSIDVGAVARGWMGSRGRAATSWIA
jgi:hypothetical protein